MYLQFINIKKNVTGECNSILHFCTFFGRESGQKNVGRIKDKLGMDGRREGRRKRRRERRRVRGPHLINFWGNKVIQTTQS
jgi:hypothetical protein